jgi:hypothetical protein
MPPQPQQRKIVGLPPDATLEPIQIQGLPPGATLEPADGTTGLEPPGFLARLSQVTLGTASPWEQLTSELRQLWEHPVETTEQALEQVVQLPRNLAYGAVVHPLETTKALTGGEQFAEDVENKNYGGAAGTLAGDALNVLLARGAARSPAAANAVRTATKAGMPLAPEARMAMQEIPGEFERAKAAPALPPETGRIKGLVRSYTGLGDRLVNRVAPAAVAQHAQETADVQIANIDAAARRQARLIRLGRRQQQLNSAVEDANQLAAREHAEAAAKIEQINEAGQEAVTHRAQLAQKIVEDSDTLGQHVKELGTSVRRAGNAKYETVNRAVADETIPGSALADDVRYAESNILQGSSENIKQFRELVAKGGSEEIKLSGAGGGVKPGHPLYDQLVSAGVIEGAKPLTFRDLQGYYTELGAKIKSANLPGDVYRAIRYMRGQIGEEMAAMAKRHGVADTLADARAFWRDYENTFHDMRPMSLGGSPVARMVRAVDPGFVAAPVLSKASARAVAMLGKYDPAVAELAAELATDYKTMSGLPKKFVPKEIPAAPTPRTPRTLEPPAPLIPKPLPPNPDLPQVVTAARHQRIGQIAGNLRSLSGWDIASIVGGFTQMLHYKSLPWAFGVTVIRHGIGALLDNPRVIRWLANPTPRDFAQLQQISPSAQQAVADVYMHQARGGRPLPLNAAAWVLRSPDRREHHRARRNQPSRRPARPQTTRSARYAAAQACRLQALTLTRSRLVLASSPAELESDLLLPRGAVPT